MTSEIPQLLVHLDAGRRVRDTVACARRLAADHGAAIAAVHAPVPAMAEFPIVPGLGPAAQTFLEFHKQRQRAVRASFDRAMRDPGPTVEASYAELNEVPLAFAFAEAGFHADLLLLTQPDPERRAEDVPHDFNEAVITASGKPCLLLPCSGDIPRRFDTIAIAWKPTREAARAVSGAMPLLRLATRVHVFAWGPRRESTLPLDLPGYLRMHGVSSQWHSRDEEPARAGDRLLAASADLGADLLVMGCYGHSRAGEWVLGGASRAVLRSMPLPVLMAH
jgi:nucleotide-binding universal stress UspA family protein